MTSAAETARKVEAILLVSPRPVNLRALVRATELSQEELQSALDELQQRYTPERSGIVLRRVAGGFQLATNPEVAPAVERFREVSRPPALSGAAHEVLAAVLYLGPLTRSSVSSVRGVNSDAVVRSLLDRELLTEAGADTTAPGSPTLLDVTDEFLLATGARDRQDFSPLDSLVDEEELERVRQRVRGAEDQIEDQSPSARPDNLSDEPPDASVDASADAGEGGRTAG